MGRPDLANYADSGLSERRCYGASGPQVRQTIFGVLLDLRHRVAPNLRAAVSHELARLRATVEAEPFDATQRAALNCLGHQVEQSPTHPWPTEVAL